MSIGTDAQAGKVVGSAGGLKLKNIEWEDITIQTIFWIFPTDGKVLENLLLALQTSIPPPRTLDFTLNIEKYEYIFFMLNIKRILNHRKLISPHLPVLLF